jgi:hypothetical protein
LIAVHKMFDQLLFCFIVSLICQTKNKKLPCFFQSYFWLRVGRYLKVNLLRNSRWIIYIIIFRPNGLLRIDYYWCVGNCNSTFSDPSWSTYASMIPRYSFGMISRQIFELLILSIAERFLVSPRPSNCLYLVLVWSFLRLKIFLDKHS